MTNKANSSSISIRRERLDIIIGALATLGLMGLVIIIQSPLVLLAIILLITGSLVLWLGYDYLPLAIFLLLPFSFEMQITSGMRITLPTEVLIPLLFLFFCFEVILSNGKIKYRPSPMNVSVLIFYCVIVGGLLISQSWGSSIKALIRDTGYIFTGYYLIPRYIRSENHLRHVVFGGLITHFLIVLYGFVTLAVGGIHIYGDIGTPFFVEHCIFAAFVTFTFAFCLAYLLDMNIGPIRNAMIFVTSLIALAIILTFVRAAWISIVVMLVYYLYQFRNRRSAVDLILVLIVFALIGIVVANITNLGRLLLQRIDTIADLKYVANYDRLDRWFAAINMWQANPYFGVGWGAYPDLYFSYQTFPDAFSSHIRMGAHNLYLELLAETGVVGLLIFLVMIYTFFRQAIMLQRTIQSGFQQLFLIGMQGAMITYLIHAFFNNLGPSDKISLFFWFFLGMIPTFQALYHFETKKKNEASESQAPSE